MGEILTEDNAFLSKNHESRLSVERLTSGGTEAPRPGISVIIVDEEGLFREGLAKLLATDPDIRVLAESANGNAAVNAVRRHRPNVVLIGNDNTNSNLAEEIRILLQAAPLSKIIVLANRDDPRRVKGLLSSGAHAYILKSATMAELLTTIRVVDRDQDRVVISVSRQTMNRLRAGSDPMLSDRELEVLGLVAEGMRNSQIANKLYIAEGTVKRHLTNIYAKLGATSRTDALRRASSAGLA